MVGISAPSASCIIFGNSDLILSNLDCDSNNVLLLDTKYYSISVKIIISEFSSQISTDLPVNAVIINGTLEEAKSVQNFDSFKQADVRLFWPGPDPTKEMFDWTIENQVEIIDLIDEPERVREALESSVWPGARMKSNFSSNHLLTSSPPISSPNNSTEQNFNRFDDDFADILEDDQLEMAELFNMIGRARSQGANMSDEERRRNAERVMCAISKMLGDDLDLDP